MYAHTPTAAAPHPPPSALLQVIVALLITMTCWRGIASKLRPHPPS